MEKTSWWLDRTALEINHDDNVDHSYDEDDPVDDDIVDGEDGGKDNENKDIVDNDNAKEEEQTCTTAIPQNPGNYNPLSAPPPPQPANAIQFFKCVRDNVFRFSPTFHHPLHPQGL